MQNNKIVHLRIYDLSKGVAKQLAPTFNLDIEGIWHTSVEVFDKEFHFQAGVVISSPGGTRHGEPLKRILMGTTEISEEMLHIFLEEMASKFNTTSYDLIRNNCNHFSNDLTNFLVSKSIPEHILELPDIILKSPLSSLLFQAGGFNRQ